MAGLFGVAVVCCMLWGLAVLLMFAATVALLIVIERRLSHGLARSV